MTGNFDLSASLRALNMSRAQLARELGIHANTVSRWAPETVPMYARAYLSERAANAAAKRAELAKLSRLRNDILAALDRACG